MARILWMTARELRECARVDATSAYRAARGRIDRQIAQIQELLHRHANLAAAKPENHGFAGDLGHVAEVLNDAIEIPRRDPLVKVRQLIDLLEAYSPDAEVQVMHQPRYPLLSALGGVVGESEIRDKGDDIGDDPEVVYLPNHQEGGRLQEVMRFERRCSEDE